MLAIWHLVLKRMIKWSLYIYVFFLAHIKFLFAASIAEATTNLNFLEILLSSTLGAIFCFNVFFFTARAIFFTTSNAKWLSIFKSKKKKKNFKKRNRWIVKIKNSKGGYYLLCTLAPLFLSIPIGTFIVVKFYGKNKFTYAYVSIVLVSISTLLAYFNHFIFH